MSRKNFGAKAYCYPQPVFIIATYDENGKPNAMNAAWAVSARKMKYRFVCRRITKPVRMNWQCAWSAGLSAMMRKLAFSEAR